MGDDASACDTGEGDDDNDKNRWCEGSPDDDDNGDDNPDDVDGGDAGGAGDAGGDGGDGGDDGDGGAGGDGGNGGTIWRVRLAHYKGGAGLLLISTINHNSMFTLCRPILPISASLCSVHLNLLIVSVFMCLCIVVRLCVWA